MKYYEITLNTYILIHKTPLKNVAAACSVGFFGSSCDRPCRYPSFGLHCQSKCSCSNETCNHVKGCIGKLMFAEVIRNF